MRSPRTLLAALLAAATVAAAAPAQAAPQPQPLERWIVRWSSPALANSTLVAAAGEATPLRRLQAVFPGAVVKLTERQAARLRSLPGVVAVERDQRVAVSGVQSSPPAGLDRADQRSRTLSRTFSNAYTGKGVSIYLVDTGLNLRHTDFTGRITPGPNLADQTNDPSDCQGHGTHVAGIAAGTRMGVAKQATLVPVKVLDCNGEGYAADTVSAIDWVVRQHQAGQPAVLNLSLTGGRSSSLDAAVQAAIDDGITVVTAAGNHDPGFIDDACQLSPSAVPAALTVANATLDDQRHPTSNAGRCVDLFAPGTDIESDWIGTTTARARDTGSSMAAPFVTGTAALVLQARPAWTPAQVTKELLDKSTKGIVGNAGTGTPNRLLYTSGGVTPALVERVGHPTIRRNTGLPNRWTLSPGSWGNTPITLHYAWYRVDAQGVRTYTGVTGRNKVVVAADKGLRLQARVTATAPDHKPAVAWSPLSSTIG